MTAPPPHPPPSEPAEDHPAEADASADQEDDDDKSKPTQRLYHHQHLPRPTNFEEQYASSSADGGPTTLMIRNVPNRYKPRELLAELEEMGFAGTFNFLYLPVDRHGWRRRSGGKKGVLSSVGYAFVNFVTPEAARRFMAVAEGYAFRGGSATRTATVSVAHIQGLQANLTHYENAAVNAGAPGERDGPILIPALAPAVRAAGAAGLEPAKILGAAVEPADDSFEDGGAEPHEPARILLGSFMGRVELGRGSEGKLKHPALAVGG